MYELELIVTPQNKNGQWSKRSKQQRIAGFSTKDRAKDYLETAVKHACKLVQHTTNTFFVEAFVLCDGHYIDADNSIVEFDAQADQINFN